MCFHTGMTQAFITYPDGGEEPQMTDRRMTAAVLQDIDRTFREDLQHLVYAHRWQPGDFIITDNLAVAHEASPTRSCRRSRWGCASCTGAQSRAPPHRARGLGKRERRRGQQWVPSLFLQHHACVYKPCHT